MKRLLLILSLFISASVFAQTENGNVPLGGPIGTIGPNDKYPTHLSHLGKGGFDAVATIAARNAIPPQRRGVGMLRYVTETNTTYQLVGDTTIASWTAVAPGNILQAIANLLPGGQKGQMLRNLETGTNKYEAYPVIKFGNFVNTPWDLAKALDQPTPTQEQIFQTWQRLAHGGRSNNPTSQQLNDTIPSNPSQTQSWSYDPVTGKVASTFNSGQLLAFISPSKYTNYTLTATLKSTDTDNDRIGAVLAAINDPNDMVRNNAYGLDSASYPGINTTDMFIPNQHTLTMLINRDTMVPKYAIWYDYGKLSRQLIYDGSALSGLFNTDNGWDVATGGVDIKVIRKGDSLFVSRSQFSDAPGGKGALGFEIGISLTQDPVLYKFRGGASYGFAVNSQALATFENTVFIGGSAGSIYDLTNNVVYIADGAGGYIIDTAATANEAIEPGQMVYNILTDRMFYKDDTFTEIKPRDNSYVDVIKEFGAVPDGVTDNTNRINAAAEYAYTSGKKFVWLGGGKFMVRKQTDTARTIIQLKSGITFKGAGMGATYIINDPTTPPQIDSIRYATQIIRTGEILNSAKDITVEDMTLIGNSSVINAGQVSASPIRGIGNVIQSTNTIPDTAALYKSHIDNVTIRKVAIYDTYNAIMNGRSILRPTGGGGGGGGSTPFMRSTDSTYFHRNWLISDVYVNGVGNRAIELSDTKDSRIENSRFFGAGFIHLLRYDFNITIEGNYMSVGADAYTGDRQGYTIAATQEAGGIYLNYGLHDIDIINNTIEMNPNINPAMVAAAPFFIRYESGIDAAYPQTTRIRSRGNTYRNTISAHKQAIRIVSPTTSIIKVTDFSFTNDIFEGVVRLRGAASDTAITVRNWTFSNSKIDSVIFVTKASTRNSGGFTFKNGTEFKKSFSVSASNVNISNSSVIGTATFASSADSLVLDNFKGTKSINASTPLPVLLNMPLLSNTATNANYVVQYANQVVNLPVITNNRTVTLPTSTNYTGQTLEIRNGNTAAFTWSFPASTVFLPNGTAITSMPNNSAYKLTSAGATWLVTSFYNDLSIYATTAYADAKVANDLTASTTVAPSKTAVNTGLSLKQNLVTLTTTGSGASTFNQSTGALNIPTPDFSAIPSVLSKITGVDAKVVANTPLYTVPVGKRLIVTGVDILVTSATGATVPATANVYTTTSGDIYVSAANGTVINTVFNYPTGGTTLSVGAGGQVFYNVTTGATATTLTYTVILRGYLI